MALLQVGGPCGQLPAHDVLYLRGRLDARLHGENRHGHLQRRRQLAGGQRVLEYARQPARDDRLHRRHRRHRRAHHARRRAERRRARDEGDDGRPVRGAARPVHPRGHAARGGGGPDLLPAARFRQAVRRQHDRRAMGNVRRCRVRGHGPGVLHRVGRHGIDVHLRQLYRQGTPHDGRGAARRRARHHRGAHGGPGHLPVVLRVRRRARLRPQPGVHHAAHRVQRNALGSAVGHAVLPVHDFRGAVHRHRRVREHHELHHRPMGNAAQEGVPGQRPVHPGAQHAVRAWVQRAFRRYRPRHRRYPVHRGLPGLQ